MMKVSFVQHGTVAPENLQDGHFWVDVGARADHQVFDHHFQKGQSSTAYLVLSALRKGLAVNGDVMVTTHIFPDLDGIFSIWLLEKASRNFFNDDYAMLNDIVDMISRHDQGIEEQTKIESSFPIIFNLHLSKKANITDQERVELGLSFIDEFVTVFLRTSDLAAACDAVRPVDVSKTLTEQSALYAIDKKKATLSSNTETISSDKKITIAHFIDPKCRLLKHYIRRDLSAINTVLIVSYPVKKNNLWRHIISVQPNANVRLHGLGLILEKTQQKKENTQTAPLPKGRERVKVGSGRFGLNVKSPWYDGRGHDYTIIDSPAIDYEGEKLIASILSPNEVIDVARSVLFSAS